MAVVFETNPPRLGRNPAWSMAILKSWGEERHSEFIGITGGKRCANEDNAPNFHYFNSKQIQHVLQLFSSKIVEATQNFLRRVSGSWLRKCEMRRSF